MMRATLLALLAASPAFAQNASTYVPGLLQALTAANLTQLATVAQTIANTSTGQALLAGLSSGNKTVFAPNNEAWTGNPPHNITDPNVIADILSYHVVSGSFAPNSFASSPAVSILRTELNASQYVQLEGNKSQVLSVTNDNGTVRILQQNTPVQVVSSTSYQNLLIHVTDAVIDIPPPLTLAIGSHNLTLFGGGITQTAILPALEATHGLTIFAPTDAAFSASLQNLGSNETTIQTVLDNHVINGTTVYSSLLKSANYTSAAGEPFTIGTNATGTYVFSGSSIARIVQTDILFSNGVLHVIDGVLFNTQSNTQAASSAVASATSVAAQSSSETGAVGGSPTSSGSSSSKSSGSNGAVSLELPIRQCLVTLGLVLGGVAFVL